MALVPSNKRAVSPDVDGNGALVKRQRTNGELATVPNVSIGRAKASKLI